MSFKPGQSGNPLGRPAGAKGKATILKEERREIFEKTVSEIFLDTIRKARPEYLLDQYLGKAEDKTQFSGEIKTSNSLTDEQISAISKWAKHKLREGN